MTLDTIKARAAQAARQAGRNPGDVTLIAVSKVQPLDRIRSVLTEGQRIFGENKVQEAQGKWPGFRETFGAVDLHLIGPLQTNKARSAMELFNTIHTVDRPKLVNTLIRLAQDIGSCPQLFIQINTGAEPQKAGVLPQDADSLIRAAQDGDLPVVGLMCIPPADFDPAPHFDMLRQIAHRNGLSGLSMGMSGDFETAIAHGATHIRVGSAIFGDRVPA
ncbi:YggS family pyridoxal phosphate-dependent enzyme [Loktanella sp. R86503]|uniref:YggS family pyridoxal phosphate-dependent enzyme n=1 Tax=Loktanella sp. R86503 TaxID=3093847 RepID=UPI0036DE1CAA